MASALTVILALSFTLITVLPSCVTLVGVLPLPIVTVQSSFVFPVPVPMEAELLTIPTYSTELLAQASSKDMQRDMIPTVSSGDRIFFFILFFLAEFSDIILITS